MQSKNNTTQGLLREMSSKTIKSPQIERISSLDSGRPPVMIFTSRGKVARKSMNSRVFETLGEDILRGRIETRNLNQQFDKQITGNNRHVNGKVTANGVSSGSLVGSTETISKLRRPAPPAPVSSQAAPATGTSLVSSRALSSSLQSLNNRHSLESDSKVQPPLIPAPKSFIQRQSSLSSSTSSLSSPQTPPTPQLQQPTMATRPITIDLTLPTPPPDANNNREDIFKASLTDKEYQQVSQFSSAKKIRAPEPPNLPSPPPPPSPPPHTSLHSPLPSPSSSPSSSSASSSPLNRFRFPPPPSTPPSPMEIPDVHTSFTNTSVSSPGLLPSQTDSDRDRKRTLSPNEVMDYFDETIGDQTVSASTYNDVSGFSQFSPVFHFPSVSDDKQPEPRSAATEAHTQIPGDVGSTVESTETATSISTVYSSKDRNEEESGDILHAEFSYSEKKTSEENSTQNQVDNSLLSPKSEEERKRRGNAASRAVAVSKLQPEVKTVRQHIKPGTVDELANLFANMKDELITSPANKGDFDFNIRQTLGKLESLDKGAESKSPVMRNAKRATILSASELFPRLQSSVSAESLQGRPRSLHSPAYSKVNQWPRLYQASSTNTLYTPPDLPDPKATAGFDFLAASREIHKHVVLIRSNSRAGGMAPSKANDLVDDSSKISDNVSNLAREPSNRNTSPINLQERNSQLTEDTEETFNRAEESEVAATMTPTTEAGIMDISRTDSAMVTGEPLRDAAGSFDATIESQFISEFPHPTITPTNSRNSSRRSSIEDNRKSETEHVPIDVSLIKTSIFSEVKRLPRSQSSSRSTSPDRPTKSPNSSRRSSLEEERQKEDTNNYSASAELEGTLSSVVTKLHTSSRSSSRSTSPDRPTRSPNSSRRSSIEVERQKEDTNNHSASAELEGTLSSVVTKLHTSSRSSSRSTSSDRPTRSPNSSRRSSIEVERQKEDTNNHSASAELEGTLSSVVTKLHTSSRSSSRSTSSDRPTRSPNSSRRSSLEVERQKEDSNKYSASAELEGTLSSVVTKLHTSSRSSSRSTSPDRKLEVDGKHALNTAATSFVSGRSRSRSSSVKSESKAELISHNLNNSSRSSTSTSPANSKSSSRAGSVRHRVGVDEESTDNSSVAAENDIVSKVAASFSPSSDTNSRTADMLGRPVSLDDHSNASFDGLLSYSKNISSFDSNSIQVEHRIAESHDVISEDYQNTTVPSNLSTHSSRSSSRSGSLEIRDYKDEVNLELPHFTVNTVAVSTVDHTRGISNSSSRSSSPEKRSTEVHTVDNELSKAESISSGSRKSSQSESQEVNYGKLIQDDYEPTALLDPTSSTSSRKGSLQGSLNASLEHPSPFVETVAVESGAVFSASHTSSKSSSRSSSPDRNSASGDMLQSTYSPVVNITSINSTPERSRRSSQADEDRMFSDQTTNEHHGHETVLPITAGSVSSRSSRSGSLKIRDDTDEVHLELSSSAVETIYINTAAVYSTNTRSSSSGSSSPHRKVSSEDITQAYDKAFVNSRASASSTPNSSRKGSSIDLTAGDRERETNVENSFTNLDHLKTDWEGFLKTETKSKEESTAAFIVGIGNTHTARANISPSSSKSSSRDGSPERNNTDDRTAMESKTVSSTPSSSRSSSRAGSVLNKVSGHDSEFFDTALVDSFGFTVKSTTSSSSSKSRSNSVNRDDNREFYLNDQNEASHNLTLSSIPLHSNNRTDDNKDLDHKSLNENYATEFVASASNSRSDSPTLIDSSATLQKEHHDSDLGKVSIPTSPEGSQKSSRDSSPDRNKMSVEHSSHHIELFGNIATSTFAARKSPASSRRSSHASSVMEDIQPRTEQGETHTFFKRSTSSSNSPVSSRRSSGSHEAESAHAYPQLHIDNMNVRKFEDTDAITVKDTSSEIKSQPHEEASHALVSIINSADMSSRMSPVSSRRNSVIGYLHYDGSQNQKVDTASLASKSSSSIKNQSSSSSSFTSTPAGSRRTSRDVDVDSVKDIELANNKRTSDLTTTSNIHAGSVTGMYVLTRSGDTSPDGSLKRAETWGDQETDSYQLALQSALESTAMTSISSSRRGSQVSFVKRGSDTNHSSSSSSKHTSRSASPTGIAGSDLKADHFNGTLERTLVTSSVSNNVSSANYTNEISNIASLAFTKSEQEVGDAYNTSLSNTENLGKATTSPFENMSYTLKDEAASVHGYSDTHGRPATPSETRVNITEGKQLDLYYTEVGSKHLADSELKDTHRSETFLPPPHGEILASNFGSYVNFSEKENISSVGSMFHLASFNSNDAYHSEVSQSLKDAGVGRSSFSASADMYSQQHLAGDRDEVARVTHVNHDDYSSNDGKLLLDTDDTPAVEYGHTVVDIHKHDREDTISQISTMSQFGSDKDGVVDIPDDSDSSDSDNSSSHKNSHDEYTVNEIPDDTSPVNAKINVYSFSDFKQGIAHTSSNQLSSSHDQHEEIVPEVITKGYETVIVASSEKDIGRGSRKSSTSSSDSDVSSSDKKGIPGSETLKYEDEHAIYENIGRKTHVLTRQENVTGQLSEVAHEQTDEPLKSLTADHTNIVSQAEVSSGLVEEKDNTYVVELRSHKDTEETSTNVFVMQLLAETDASTSTIAVEPATPGVHGDMEMIVTPATDQSTSSPPKDFLSVLEDINIETDITSAFLRRSSRFSGTYSPARRQSRGDSGEGTTQTNTGFVRDSATEATLSSTSFILRDYQAKDTAHTTDDGSQELVSGVSVGKDVADTDITFSHFVSELKEGTVENTDVSHSESLSLTVNDRMHNVFDGASLDSVQRKDVDNDLNIDYYTDTDDVSRKISVEEIIYSAVRNTEESHTGRFDLSAETDTTLSSGNDTDVSQPVHKTRTEVVDPTYIVADADFNNKTEGMYVNDDLTSQAGDIGVYEHDKEDQIVALRVYNTLQTEYVNDSVHQYVDELSASETVAEKVGLGVKEDREHVHSYVNDIIHHSVNTINTEDTDISNHVHDWEANDREDKQQVYSYVSGIIHHSVDTVSTEDTDKLHHVHDGNVHVREDKQQVHSYVSGIIHDSVDTVSTEDTDKLHHVHDGNIDVREDKEQVHAYVSGIIHDSVDTVSTEDTDKLHHVHDGNIDVREDKEQVHAYVSGIIHDSVDTVSTEDTDKLHHVHDGNIDVREDKEQVHAYVSGIIHDSVDTISTEDTDKFNHDHNWKSDDREDKQHVHSYVSDIIHHSVDTVSTEDTDKFNHAHNWKADVREDKQQLHSYVSDITHHSFDTISTEDTDNSNQGDDWNIDVKEDKQQVHSYVSGIIEHSVDTISTEDTDRNILATDWKIETDSTDIYNNEAVSEMKIVTPATTEIHVHEVEMDSRVTTNEISDSLDMPFDELTVERRARADIHTYNNTSGDISQSYPEHGFRENTVYESFDHMEATKSSTDAHLHFSEVNISKEHAMQRDASPDILDHHVDGFSLETLKEEEHLDRHEEKPSINAYVGDIITHSVHTVNAESTESTELAIHEDHVTPSHLYVDHSAHHAAGEPDTQSHATAFEHHFNVDSKYVNTSSGHDHSTDDHSSQLNIAVNHLFNEAELADTALLPSNMYDSVVENNDDDNNKEDTIVDTALLPSNMYDSFIENNDDDNNKEETIVVYEEMQSEDMHQTNATTHGLHIFNDDLEARATDNEDINPHIISGLESTNVNYGFHESHEKVQTRLDDQDEFVSEKHLLNESRDSHTNNILHRLIDDMNTDTVRGEDHVFEINKQNASSEAYIGESAFDFLHESPVEEHPPTSMQDDATVNKYMELTGDAVDSVSEFNIEASRHEDLQTVINSVTQSEKVYVNDIDIVHDHHLTEVSIEETKIKSKDVLHKNTARESLYINDSTEVPSEIHKVYQVGAEIDLDDEIRKQHQILSQRLNEDDGYEKALTFSPDISRSSRSSSIDSNQIADRHHTTRETAFNSEFFVRSHSSSVDGNHELSRQNSGLVTAPSPLFLHEDNDSNSLAELQYEEHLDTVKEFTRTLDLNNEHSISSRSSVYSDESGHQTRVTSDSFRLDNALDTEKQRSLPSTDSLIVEDNSFHKNIKLEYERLNSIQESTDFGSVKAHLDKDVEEFNGEHVSQDRFGFQDQPERNSQESDADFKSVKQTTEEYISVARLSQTLHSVSNDDDSAKQKEDESHLFSKDKFQALRNVFEKQETAPETSSFKTKRNSYKLGIGSNSTSESLHGRNWELNRQVSSGSSVTSTSKKEMHGHLTSAAQIEDYTSIESGSDRVMTKWSGSDPENNQNMQDQVNKKMEINKKLSYDLHTRQLRRGSASSLSSASSEDSTKHNHGEGHSSHFTADDHYPKNNLFSQKPGLINMTQWNTQSMYGNGSELAQIIRRSSVSSDRSSASQKEVAGHITADYHASIHKEKSQELHSFSDTDQNQILEIPGEVTNPLFSDTSSTDDEELHSLSDTNQNQLLEIPGELTNPLFGDTSSTDGEKLDFRKRADSSNSLSSDESSSLEIEDHSLFSQEAVGRFSPSGDQEATHIQASFVRDTNNRNSDKSSVRSQSTLRSSVGGVNDSISLSDTNFSFRKNNPVVTNTTESPTDHAKPQVAQQHASESSDRGAAVRRHSSSGSEKEAKLIGAFLRSNVRSPLNRSFSNISYHSSENGNVKSHHSAEPVRHAYEIDPTQNNRRASSSTDSSDSVKGHLPRPAGSAHSEISLAEAYKNEARNYEDLTSVIDHNTQKHTFQSEEAFTVVSHNFSQRSLRRDSLSSQEDTNKSHIYLTPEEQNEFRSRSENGDSPINFDDRPAVKTYVIKRSMANDVYVEPNEYLHERSMANDVYVEPNEYLHESVFSNSRPGVTQNSSRDFYTSSSAVPVTAAREVTESYSETQLPTRQWQSSQLGVDSFNQGITSKKENLSLEHDWGYRDKIDSHLKHDGGEKRYEIKRTGLDTSPIFPSLLSRDTSVQETNRYTAVSHDRDIFSEGYTSPHGLYDGHGYSSSGVPLTHYAEKETVLRLQSRAPHIVNTTNLVEKSPTSLGANFTTILRNRQSPIEDRFQFTPITISTASQAVVGNKVGVHIDFSPPGAPHSLHDISSSSDEESNRQRFVVKNVQQTSVLKNNFNNSSEIIFTKEEATRENVNRITNASGSLSPRTVVDGPIFRTYQSQRSHLSRSHSSDNSLELPLEYNNDSSPQVYDPVVTNNHSGDENGHLYQVLNVSSNGLELSNSETERGRSRNRNRDISGTKNQSTTPRKKHHSPERFFKNPKLSLRQEDYDNKGYSSDDEEGKHYQHVTRVYLSGETPRSRSQSPSTNYRVSSLKSQNDLEKDRSKVRSSSNLRNGSEISDNDSHSEFQGQKYKVIGTSDSSLDTHKVRAHSSPKLGRKQENYFQETAITRTQPDQPSQLNNASVDRQTHKSVVQLEVGSNYITEKRGPEDIQDSRYAIKRVRSADDLRDTFADSEDVQGSSDRKMWKTGRSSSTDTFLSRGDAVDGEFEPTGLYDPAKSFVTTTHMDNKMYVVNKTVSNRKGGDASTPHGWYTSTVDHNERGPTRIPSHDDKIHSQNYKTEKTLYLSNTASPPPNTGHALERTRQFVFQEYGQGAEINNSDGGNEHRQKAERFERINEEMAEPHDLDYTRSTEDLSNDLRVLRGKILIKNRFDSAEFSEDDFDQNANLFDTSFHLGKDNPVYSSDQDITASLRREEERDISKHVTQDITFETVDKLAHQYKADRQVQLSPGPQRKKPNLSSLLLSKLALVDSKDIRQTVDVEHHNEEIHGDIRFVHADGEQKASKDTYNFDSVNEKVELTLTQGKANVIIKVIAERVVPTGVEFNTWRKSQAIVTRHIEIDLQANEQMKRLYKRVMSKTGNSGSLDGSGRLSSYNSASLSAKDREMNSMETLKLFTQILEVAEQQSNRDNADSRVRHDLGQLPASVMDMLY